MPSEKASGNKYAILSMDIEDWYHLDYFRKVAKAPMAGGFSMLDGLDIYMDILARHDIKTTFFVLSELLPKVRSQVLAADAAGHEIACHGKTHDRPLTQSVSVFRRAVMEAKGTLSDVIGCEVLGYRAPCYSIDNERYDILRDIGFVYSSSRMEVSSHPLYGELDLTNYVQSSRGIYEKEGFMEFSLSTAPFMGRNVAISGGGWIRLLPWRPFMKPLIKRHLNQATLYTLYIHPFEISERKMPWVKAASPVDNLRAHVGRGHVVPRIEQLIDMLKRQGFTFCTYRDLVKESLYHGE